MSETNTPAPAPSELTTIEQTALASLPTIIGMVAGNALAGVSTTVQTDITTFQKSGDAEIATLKAKLDAFEVSDPLVAELLTAGIATAKALGVVLPTEAQIFGHAQAAFDAVCGAVEV